MRPESNADRGSPVCLGARRQYRGEPFFVLDGGGDIHVLVHPPVKFYGAVVNCFASGDEVAGNGDVPVAELQIVARTEAVGAPALNARAVASNPAGDQVVLVGVEVMIKNVP